MINVPKIKFIYACVCIYIYTRAHTHKRTYIHVNIWNRTLIKFAIQLNVSYMFKCFQGSVYVPIKCDSNCCYVITPN